MRVIREQFATAEFVGQLLVVCSILLAISNFLGIINISWWLTLLPAGIVFAPLLVAAVLCIALLAIGLPIALIVFILLLIAVILWVAHKFAKHIIQ